ncbi:hypothetical protein MAXJ12_12986 [Mesorhizobium alhagi CCNWXJ12-2]|uniref:Uncharacterized protein n=1 Tax=Mesorhizobium alhagi CCNWXJ12-2 TaxID=1107882 RepID=H0HR14_9HYPH|nr:hypothetical protein MAXJ12_12986 [Mesorhizobium alhagi CCNWXJ12-2]
MHAVNQNIPDHKPIAVRVVGGERSHAVKFKLVTLGVSGAEPAQYERWH